MANPADLFPFDTPSGHPNARRKPVVRPADRVGQAGPVPALIVEDAFFPDLAPVVQQRGGDEEAIAFLRKQGAFQAGPSDDPLGMGVANTDRNGAGGAAQTGARVVEPAVRRLERSPPPLPVFDPNAPRMGRNARAARAVRTPDPSRFPVPPGGRDGRYVAWDLDDEIARVMIGQLAWLDGAANADPDSEENRQREVAASWLVEAWESRWGEPPSLGKILQAWWRAARQVVDVAIAAGRPGVSPNAVFGRLMGQAGMDFAQVLGLEERAYAREMERLGLPRPPMTDEKGNAI